MGKKKGGVCIVSSEKLFSLMMALSFMGTKKTQTEHYVALVPPRGWGTHGMFSVRTMLTLSKLFHIHYCLPTALRADGSDIIRFNLKMNPGVKTQVQRLEYVPFSSLS